MNLEATGKLIFEQRKKIGITQRQLGERLGVTNTAVSKWERGLSYPDVVLLPSLANELSITVSEIIYGKKSVESEKIEGDETAKEVITIADKQIKRDRKKFRKIIIAFSVIMAVVVIAFAATAVYFFAFSFWDVTKWQTEITAKSYFDESSYTLPVKARVGNPHAYYGESFLVIKDTRISQRKILDQIEVFARRDGKETVDLNTGYLIVDKENIGNGYVFIFDRPERSDNIYFYSAGVILKNSRGDEGLPIAFPLYLLDEAVYNCIYENVEYHFGYGAEVTEETKRYYMNRFVDFYTYIGGYDLSLSDKNLVVTESDTKKTITIYFDAVSSVGAIRITK